MQNGFYFYHGNRQEELLETLASVVRNPMSDPLAQEHIIVQHHGMQRWVSLQLADKNRILANTRFLFPNELVNLALRSVIPDFTEMLSKEELQWKVFEQLMQLNSSDVFADLVQYREANKSSGVFHLAGQIADQFDQYEMFRPELIMQWSQGKDSHWQAELWRSLPESYRKQGKANLLKTFFAKLAGFDSEKTDLPERVSIFGISYLPPMHLHMLQALSQLMEVHLFFLSPTGPDYWGDLSSRKDQLKRLKHDWEQKKDILSVSSSFHSRENELLSSWGIYGRNFFYSMYSDQVDLQEPALDSLYKPIHEEHLLGRIQTDIFHPFLSSEEKQFQGKSGDPSFQVHSCHSSMREVEVLKDELLRVFQETDILPEDVLVMTPDIEEFAPYILSVFSPDQNDPHYIPYSIADRVFTTESQILSYFLNLVELHQSRFKLGDLFALFESESIREKFQLTEKDIEQIRDWLEAVNVRWGLDGNDKERFDLPENYLNTWQFGVDRLLTGFMMPGRDSRLVSNPAETVDILPFDHLEGSAAFLFARFLDFLEEIREWISSAFFQEKHVLSDWKDYLMGLRDAFFSTDQAYEQELTGLGTLLARLSEMEEKDTFQGEVDLGVIQVWLKQEMNGLMQAKGFLGYGMTFCSMKPMRSIPFRMIAVLGMNEKSFPRKEPELSFNLTGLSRKWGDRSMKDEDRYLFLEALTNARDRFYLSYQGMDIQKNTRVPASSMITELLGYISEYYPEYTDQKLLVQHPLQAFSPIHFDHSDQRIFSFSKEAFNAAEVLLHAQKKKRAIKLFQLTEPEDKLVISLDDLSRFFNNPSKHILNKRLGLYLSDRDEEVPDYEPFQLNRLDQYALQQIQLENTVQGRESTHSDRILKASGTLPYEKSGDVVLEESAYLVQEFYSMLQGDFEDPVLDPLDYDLDFGKVRLKGSILSARSSKFFRYRLASIKFKDRFSSWLEHITAQIVQKSGYPAVSILAGYDKKNGKIQLLHAKEVEQPGEELKKLIHFYWEGMSEPLAFFPEAAMEYAVKTWGKKPAKDQASVLAAVQKKLEASEWGEVEFVRDSYFQYLFGDKDIFNNTEFINLTHQLLENMFRNQKEGGIE